MDEYSIWTLLEKYNKKIEKNNKLRTQQQAKEEIKETESPKPIIKIYGLSKGAIVKEAIIEKTPNGGAYSIVHYMSGGGLAELIRKRLQQEQPGITDKEIVAAYFKNLPGGRVDALRGIRAIKAAGGIAVWAHPLGGTGERRISAENFSKQLDLLCSVGLDGLECYYSEFTKEEIEMLCNTATQKGLKISGGSDYHGTGKPHLHLGMLNKEDAVIAEEKLTVMELLR